MARKRKRLWSKIFLYLMLEVGAMAGVPMRPDQIVELTRMIHNTQVVQVVRREDLGDGDPPD